MRPAPESPPGAADILLGDARFGDARLGDARAGDWPAALTAGWGENRGSTLGWRWGGSEWAK